MLKYNLLISFLLILTACNPSDFGASYDSVSSNPVGTDTVYQKYSCEQNYTTVPTMVDFLFLWDNSSSQYFVTAETKAALNNLINNISTKFNYRILIAPLIPYPDAPLFLVTYDTNGLNSYAQDLIIPKTDADDKLSQFISYPGQERGLSRTLNLLTTHFPNGIFRRNAYTNIVIMSNGDDQTITSSEPAKIEYATQEAASLSNFASQTLHTFGLRFLSITAHNVCGTGFIQNIVYRKVSELIKDSNDAYNICNQSFTNVFTGINNTIAETNLPHTYNYWPIRDPGSAPINTESIIITNKDGSIIPPCPSTGSCSYGFRYLDEVRTVNTRIIPAPPGEPFTGYSIELFNGAQVTYPNCLNVQYDTKTYYYGYIRLPSMPLAGSIQLTINGTVIPEDSTNGWSYYGYQENLNLKIVSPTDDSGETPGEFQTGYFLKLHGSAVYHSGDAAVATCLPTT